MLRDIRADNPSPMTLDGTRTYIVGRRRIAIIDPGPASASHIDAIIDAVDAAGRDSDGDAVRASGSGAGNVPDPDVASRSAVILLTHMHPDHAAGAPALARYLAAPVRAIADGSLRGGDVLLTDAGAVSTLHTPGHTPDHASFWLPDASTVFCGDLMMGGLDTALVAPPEGNLRRYLDSLRRLRALRPARIAPAHGPSFDDADAAIGLYIHHRMDRCRQVADALADHASLSTREVAAHVYRDVVPDELYETAVAAVVAYLEYLAENGSVVRDGDRWRRTG